MGKSCVSPCCPRSFGEILSFARAELSLSKVRNDVSRKPQTRSKRRYALLRAAKWADKINCTGWDRRTSTARSVSLQPCSENERVSLGVQSAYAWRTKENVHIYAFKVPAVPVTRAAVMLPQATCHRNPVQIYRGQLTPTTM